MCGSANLGMKDSNLQMSFWKMPFEMSGGFLLIREHLGIRDFSRTNCQNTDIHLRLDWLCGWPGLIFATSRDWPTRVRLRPAASGVFGTSSS
jgi:hypothetical protein